MALTNHLTPGLTLPFIQTTRYACTTAQGSSEMLVQPRLFAEWTRDRELLHGSVAANKGVMRLYCGRFLPGVLSCMFILDQHRY